MRTRWGPTQWRRAFATPWGTPPSISASTLMCSIRPLRPVPERRKSVVSRPGRCRPSCVASRSCPLSGWTWWRWRPPTMSPRSRRSRAQRWRGNICAWSRLGPDDATVNIFGRIHILEHPNEGEAMRTVTVKADWDDEAQVWYVRESDLPGLHIEAETPVELYSKLPGAIEDLLERSGEREVSFDFITPGRVKIA